MVKLVEKSPVEGLLPMEINGLSLTELVPGAITSVMPYAGQKTAASEALKALVGAAMPGPNRSTGREGARVVWTGAGQAMVIGAALDPSLAQHAAMTDQSDAWTVFRLEGQGVEEVLARLTPLDLNPGVFKRGHAARSLAADYATILMYHRFGEDRYPSTNVTLEQFEEHLEILASGRGAVQSVQSFEPCGEVQRRVDGQGLAVGARRLSGDKIQRVPAAHGETHDGRLPNGILSEIAEKSGVGLL